MSDVKRYENLSYLASLIDLVAEQRLRRAMADELKGEGLEYQSLRAEISDNAKIVKGFEDKLGVNTKEGIGEFQPLYDIFMSYM